MANMEALAFFLFVYYIAGAGGLPVSHVVVFGDSYSDNGDGFAAYARYVLRTNSVRSEALFAPRGINSFATVAQADVALEKPQHLAMEPYTVSVCRVVLQTWPEEPYFKGRWSNGPMWIEEAAASLKVNLTDYAAGGATTGSVPGRE